MLAQHRVFSALLVSALQVLMPTDANYEHDNCHLCGCNTPLPACLVPYAHPSSDITDTTTDCTAINAATQEPGGGSVFTTFTNRQTEVLGKGLA